MVSAVTKESPPIVTCLDENRHDFETGDYVQFTEVEGMSELNGAEPIQITVTGPYTFSLNADVPLFGDYIRGGFATQVKMPVSHDFLPLKEASKERTGVLTDFAKMGREDSILQPLSLLEFMRPKREDFQKRDLKQKRLSLLSL